MTKISDALTYGLTIRESANDGSDFTNPVADYRRLFLGEDGALHLKDSAGAVTATAGSETLPVSIIAAKGDLIAGTANDTAAVLTVGTDDYVLTAASGEATGLKWAAAASGGMTHAYAGYNTAGGTAEDVVVNRNIAKSITLAADSFIASIDVYLQMDTGPDTFAISVGVWTDNAATTGNLVAVNAPYGAGSSQSIGAYANILATTPRWVTIPIGLWAPAGTYWIGFLAPARGYGGNRLQCYRDASGSDRRFDSSAAYIQDGGIAAQTDTTYKYSIRASILT